MAQTQNNCNTINKYVQQNIQRHLQFIQFPAKDDRMKTPRVSTDSFLIAYVSSFCLVGLRCHGDDL